MRCRRRDWTGQRHPIHGRLGQYLFGSNLSRGDAELGNPVALTAGFFLFLRLHDKILRLAQDDPTDDCAPGAMMLLKTGRSSENYVFR
jgi:hypothetical protein